MEPERRAERCRHARGRGRPRVRGRCRERGRLAHSGCTVFCSGSARVRSFASAGFANATELEAGLMRLGTPAGLVGLASAVRARATQRMSGARGRARSIIEEVLEDCLARGQQVIQQRFRDDEAGLASGYLGDPLGHVREPE